MPVTRLIIRFHRMALEEFIAAEDSPQAEDASATLDSYFTYHTQHMSSSIKAWRLMSIIYRMNTQAKVLYCALRNKQSVTRNMKWCNKSLQLRYHYNGHQLEVGFEFKLAHPRSHGETVKRNVHSDGCHASAMS
eukprot:1313118-Pleurochrysis_carterae.AAC.1